jgi:hypothetical protein
MPAFPPPTPGFYHEPPHHYGEDEDRRTNPSLSADLVWTASRHSDEHYRWEDCRDKQVPWKLTGVLQPGRASHSNGDDRDADQETAESRRALPHVCKNCSASSPSVQAARRGTKLARTTDDWASESTFGPLGDAIFIRLFSLQRVFARPCAPHPLLDIVWNGGPAPHARKTAPELRIGSGLMLNTVNEHRGLRSEQIFQWAGRNIGERPIIRRKVH